MKKILVVLDTVRKSNMSVYGYERETTPFLSDLADRSTLFINAYSNSIWTAPSHASMFSGKVPAEHETNTLNPKFKDASKVKEYEELGFSNYCISNNSAISEEFGYGEDFKEMFSNSKEIKFSALGVSKLAEKLQDQDLSSLKDKGRFAISSIIDDPAIGLDILRYYMRERDLLYAEYTRNLFSKKLEEGEDQLFFINFTDAHFPYDFSVRDAADLGFDFESLDDYVGEVLDKKEESKITQHINFNGEKLEKAYDASIKALDRVLESLFEDLESLDEEFQVIVTSDHGEVIDQDFPIHGHQCIFSKELISVPLIFFDSRKAQDNQVDDLFSLKDVFCVFEGEIPDRAVVNFSYTGLKYINHSLYQKAESGEKDLAEKEISLLYNEFNGTITSFSGRLNVESTCFGEIDEEFL